MIAPCSFVQCHKAFLFPSGLFSAHTNAMHAKPTTSYHPCTRATAELQSSTALCSQLVFLSLLSLTFGTLKTLCSARMETFSLLLSKEGFQQIKV